MDSKVSIVINIICIIVSLIYIYELRNEKNLNEIDSIFHMLLKGELLYSFIALLYSLCLHVNCQKKYIELIFNVTLVGIIGVFVIYFLFKAMKKYFCVEKISRLEKENLELRTAIENNIENKGEKY